MNFLINMTEAVTVTAMLLILIKRVFKDKFTPKWHVLIWGILLVRIMIPTLPESNVSVFNLVPDIQGAYNGQSQRGGMTHQTVKPGGTEMMAETQGTDTGGTNLETKPVTGLSAKTVGEEARAKTDKMLLTIYWSGMFLMGAMLLLSYGIFIAKMRKLPLCTDKNILAVLEFCKGQVGLSERRISLKQGAKSPMLMGIIKPTVYISEGYNYDEMKHIITHELCHHKSGDILWNVISSVILCLNWFNPVAWYAFKCFRRDLEIYCDYRTVNITGKKKEYAEVLLKTASRKNSFVFATSCLENGQAEVSRRIKKLAYFNQPKVWVSAAGLVVVIVIGVFCLTNAPKSEGEALAVGVCGPTNSWDEYVMEIPTGLGIDYDDLVPKATHYGENKIFKDKKGNVTVAISYVMPDIPVDEGTVDYGSLLAESISENSEAYKRLNDESLRVSAPLDVKNKDIYEAYKVQYVAEVEKGSAEDKKDGVGDGEKAVRTEIYLFLSERPQIVPFLYTENPSISEEELIQAALSIRKSEAPESYRPIGRAEMFTDGKTGAAIAGGEYDARALLDEYFDNYVKAALPASRSIRSYKINSMEEIGPVGDIPGIIDKGMLEGEGVPWNIIYPSARVYKIDYELVPKDSKRYRDVAGGGFDITGTGGKHYTESYGVFYSYSVDGATYEAAFLGFLHPSNLAEFGVDYSVYRAITTWYNEQVWPKVLANARVNYVGDAPAVGKLVGMLPLHEYTDGIDLQTTTEPYGVTVNYKIGRGIDYNSETGGTLSAWPEVDGDLSGIYSKVGLGKGAINYYINDQIHKNNRRLMESIENVGSVKGVVSSPYTEASNSNVLLKD